MKRFLYVFVLVHLLHGLSAQYWSKQFDSASGAGDAILFVDAIDNEVVCLSKSTTYASGVGGIVFRRLHRKTGKILAEAKFTLLDSLSTIGSAIRINDNLFAILYTTNAWGSTAGAYHNLRYLDSMGQSLSLYRLGHYAYPIDLANAVRTTSGFCLATTSLPPWASLNSHVKLVGLDGEIKWEKGIDSFSTRYFNDVLALDDTIVLLQGSGSGIRLIQLDSLGREVKRSGYSGHDSFVGLDLHFSSDKSRYVVAGYVGSIGTNPQAIMVLDRGLHLLDFQSWNIGTGGIARAVVENRLGEYLLVGHARYEGVFGNRDNAFVMRIDPDGLVQKSLHFYTPSGEQSDGKIQIILTADVQDSILYIAGHGGINDTSGSEDDWILALTDLGTCDTADCFPWLISGLVEVPAEWMEQWTVGTGTDAWHVHMEQPALWRQGARWVLYDRTGKRLRDVPADGPELRLPYEGIPSGPYILEWRRDHQRMARRIARP